MNNVIKPNTKIKILSEEHSEYVQKLAFEAGFSWNISGKRIVYTDEHYLTFQNVSIRWEDDLIIFTKLHHEEIFIPLPNQNLSPKPPFKIRNANHPAVRQWLKDMGFDFASAPTFNILTTHVDMSFGVVDECGHFIVFSGEDYFIEEGGFTSHSYPELTLNLAVESWSLPEPIGSAKQDRLAKIEELEKTLKELKEIE